MNSEIFGDLNQISSDFNRADGLSSVLVRATDAATVPALINSLNDDRRLDVAAQTEKAYYDSQTSSGAILQYLGIFVSVIMAVGSSFAAMNTMYAAVARRAREIGTLRVLGFSRGSILISFFFESVLLSVLGGLLGCLLVLPLNNMTTGIGSFVTFSEIAFNFRVSPEIMAAGIAFALVMGAVGGLFPARIAAKKEILTALRDDLEMEAELKSLRIDRSKKRRDEPSPWAARWIVAGIAAVRVAGRGTLHLRPPECRHRSRHRARPHCFRGAGRRRQRDSQRHRLHRGRAQDRTGGQSDRQGRLDRRGKRRQGQTARCWCAWKTTNIAPRCSRRRAISKC